ncbi:hypothetical protein BDN70DRAFT_874338 [Pholiota conissans]|uniref:F-box domain-containing protein n=1 Tax=Pholiota conissans TaxID=109636 RepID=A0A9P5ZAH4_9AGAR|nr:hypothetical protein BDN70DRAFT_874338 [Pholiota conissans]
MTTENTTEHVPPCPNLAKGLSCDPCKDLAAIYQEILAAEAISSTLLKKRAKICRRRNHVHDSLTSRLPPELISRIFIEFLPASVSRSYRINLNCKKSERTWTTTPYVLGTVSTGWRAITWSTPQLWTSISIDLAYTSETFVTLLTEWLCRSGSLCLYVNIYTTEYSALLDESPLKQISAQISNLLARHMSKWCYLQLEVPSVYFPCICSGIGSVPQLSILDIRVSGPEHAPIKLESVPNLKRLFIRDFDIRMVSNIDWKKLTHFNSAFHSIDMVHQLFSNALFLEHCTFYLLGGLEHNQRQTTRNTVLRHDHLVFLQMEFWMPGMDTVVEWLEFPALQHLIAYKQTHSLADLIRRSSCPLKTLELFVDVKYEDQEVPLIPFVADIPSLEVLRLNDYSNRESGRYCIDPLFLQLSEAYIADTRRPFLPNLEVLDLTLTKFSWISLLDFLVANSDSNMRPIMTKQTIDPLDAGLERHDHGFRSLEAMDIRLWNVGAKFPGPDLDTTRKLLNVIEDISLQIYIADSYIATSIPFPAFLQQRLSALQ